MKNPTRALSLLGSIVASLALLVGLTSPADAVTRPLRDLGKDLSCKSLKDTSYGVKPSPDEKAGAMCRVDQPRGKQKIALYRYGKGTIGEAVVYWRQVTAEGNVLFPQDAGCFVKKGRTLLVPLGSKTDVAYSAKWCRYVAKRTGGRIVKGYLLAARS